MFQFDDLILRPTTFGPSAAHYDPRLGSQVIERLGDACYWLLWFPAAWAVPGDIVIENLAEAVFEICPHCEEESCPVLARVRALVRWRRFCRSR